MEALFYTLIATGYAGLAFRALTAALHHAGWL